MRYKMAKKIRKCKQCETLFEKDTYNPLQMFCRSSCGYAYKKEKQLIKNNGQLQPKQSGSRSSKTKDVLPDGTVLSESAVFERIWGVEPEHRISFVTGKLLPDIHNARAWYFSHVLPKAKNRYPMFKYYAKNIVLKTFEEHTNWEHNQYKLIDVPGWKKVFELKEELIEEYEQHEKEFKAGRSAYFKV